MIDRYRDGYIDRYIDNGWIHKYIDTQMIATQGDTGDVTP